MTEFQEGLLGFITIIGLLIVLILALWIAIKIEREIGANRKKHLEDQLRYCTEYLDLELTIRYVRLMIKMGYETKEIISEIYFLTGREVPHK